MLYAAGDWTVEQTGEHIHVALGDNYEPVTKERLHRLLTEACLRAPEITQDAIEIGALVNIDPIKEFCALLGEQKRGRQ